MTYRNLHLSIADRRAAFAPRVTLQALLDARCEGRAIVREQAALTVRGMIQCR